MTRGERSTPREPIRSADHFHDATKSVRQCVTHHHACDCREAAHAAEVARLRALLRECASDLEDELRARYGGSLQYPSEARRFENDMAPVAAAWKALDGR